MKPISALVVALLSAAVALSGCGDSDKTSAELQGYRSGPGSNQITVLYGARPGDEAGSAEVLAQDSTQVKVRVMYQRSSKPQDDVLQRKEVVAALEAPLGDRKVVDESGVEVPRQS
jgi:hypothetical protein